MKTFAVRPFNRRQSRHNEGLHGGHKRLFLSFSLSHYNGKSLEFTSWELKKESRYLFRVHRIPSESRKRCNYVRRLDFSFAKPGCWDISDFSWCKTPSTPEKQVTSCADRISVKHGNEIISSFKKRQKLWQYVSLILWVFKKLFFSVEKDIHIYYCYFINIHSYNCNKLLPIKETLLTYGLMFYSFAKRGAQFHSLLYGGW